jgi:hypothetical protein
MDKLENFGRKTPLGRRPAVELASIHMQLAAARHELSRADMRPRANPGSRSDGAAADAR